jgi:hypothetical protein
VYHLVFARIHNIWLYRTQIASLAPQIIGLVGIWLQIVAKMAQMPGRLGTAATPKYT